jgi:hypothetical protein
MKEQQDLEQWLALRKEAGLLIDLVIAESKLGFPAGLRTEEPERSSDEDDSFGVYLLNWLITRVDAVSPGMFWAHGDMPIGRGDTVKRLETATS